MTIRVSSSFGGYPKFLDRIFDEESMTTTGHIVRQIVRQRVFGETKPISLSVSLKSVNFDIDGDGDKDNIMLVVVVV